MKKYLEQFKNLKTNILSFFKINPHKHWMFLLDTFFVLVFIFTLFSFYLLLQIKNEKLFKVEPINDKQQVILKEDLLKKIIDNFENKAVKERQIINSTSPYKDPSI